MKILGIDPGQTKSGVVILDTEKQKVLYSKHLDNHEIFASLGGSLVWSKTGGIEGLGDSAWEAVAIEDIQPQGYAVGNTTFDTLRWVGRFEGRCWVSHTTVRLIGRGDEKIVLCGCKTFIDPKTNKRQGIKDAQIRQAIIDMFPATGGGKRPVIGTKKQPGPLYGVSGHCWSALSVAITYWKTQEE